MTVYHGFAAAFFVVALVALVASAYHGNGKWVGWVLLGIASAVLWFASGCSTIDRHAAPPGDWPALRVVVHKSGFMGKRECDGLIGGCAVADFCARRCDIYLQIDSQAIEQHERAHCAGYDHPGDDTMRSAWIRYRDGDQPAFCALRMGSANYCALWGEDRIRCP